MSTDQVQERIIKMLKHEEVLKNHKAAQAARYGQESANCGTSTSTEERPRENKRVLTTMIKREERQNEKIAQEIDHYYEHYYRNAYGEEERDEEFAELEAQVEAKRLTHQMIGRFLFPLEVQIQHRFVIMRPKHFAHSNLEIVCKIPGAAPRSVLSWVSGGRVRAIPYSAGNLQSLQSQQNLHGSGNEILTT